MNYNIACGIDCKYIEPLLTMLNSLFDNNKECSFSIYLFSLNLSNEDKEFIQRWIFSTENTITFIDISKEKINSFPIHENDTISLATYLRLFIPLFLPQRLKRVLYLDVDLLIHGSIKDLYQSNLTGFALAGIENGPIDSSIATEISPHKYFNAGVLLLNLDYLRRDQFTTKAINFISQHPAQIKFHDQDVLNALLASKCLFVKKCWNVQENDLPNVSLEKDGSYIIHFSGRAKPWHTACMSPYKQDYQKYRPQITFSHTLDKNEVLKYYPRYQQILFRLQLPRFLFLFLDNMMKKFLGIVIKLHWHP